MTLEAWADLDEDEPGELVDGRLVEEEVPSHLHEVVLAWLLRVLGSWAEPRRCLVFGSEHKLAVSATRGRKPDVSMYPPGMRLGARASMSRTPPALLIEVISARARDVRRDRLEKVNEYAAFGVRWYWMLDPTARVLEILELQPNGRYALERSVGEGPVRLPGFEGLEVDLSALWERVDQVLSDDEEGVESGEG